MFAPTLVGSCCGRHQQLHKDFQRCLEWDMPSGRAPLVISWFITSSSYSSIPHKPSLTKLEVNLANYGAPSCGIHGNSCDFIWFHGDFIGSDWTKKHGEFNGNSHHGNQTWPAEQSHPTKKAEHKEHRTSGIDRSPVNTYLVGGLGHGFYFSIYWE